MKLRLFRIGVPLVWLIASITVLSIYFYYAYTNASINRLVKQIKFRSPIVIEDHEMNSSGGDKKSDNRNYMDSPSEEEDNYDNMNMNDMPISNNLDNRDNLLEIKDNSQCHTFNEAEADMNTREMYSQFDFDAKWIKNKGIWSEDFFENRYKEEKAHGDRPPLHVVILPHSHNDPGWLKTFEEYFNDQTKNILNSAVDKLPGLPDMTFIWTEISFLSLWFETASPMRKKIFKDLVQSGRIEITTGGYVMTDEATVHIYAMVDQLIEGHQWVMNNLNITPTHGWSIDPFGHGSTVPYLLSLCDFDGAIIQRIHYNWKEYMARRQWGDFVWKPQWDSSHADERSLLMHNMPFDMYFVDAACGPHKDKCGPFDFRWYRDIDDKLVKDKADQLIAEYERSASLYSHNVFLAIVGGDFRYDMPSEFDMQHTYKKLIDFVNANGKRYNNAKLQFGTPKDYFRIVRERTKNKFPTLSGDLFPYVDVFTDGVPGFWTGYYTTRPFIKLMIRDLENHLRNSEILFTLAFNRAGRRSMDFGASYHQLTKARKNLAILQHHDAITGTSRAKVMENYRNRMFESIKDLIAIQQFSLEKILSEKFERNSIVSTWNYTKSEIIPSRITSQFTSSKSAFHYILFNSLGHERIEIATVRVSKANVRVSDADGNKVSHQVNYLFKHDDDGTIIKLDNEFEVIFIARLPALSIVTYTVTYIEEMKQENIATFEVMDVANVNDGEIFIQNHLMRLAINGSTGFMKSITTGGDNLQVIPVEINFSAYNTAKGKSGAYLFKTDAGGTERDIFVNDTISHLIIIKGNLASYVTVIYGSLLQHTIRVLNTQTHLDNAIFIENHLSVEKRHSNAEIFMRIKTSIDNGNDPEFHTDLNGFQWLKRKRVARVGVEGNFYPITSTIFIQDKNLRATLVTNHAQGATSSNTGEMEVMLDKRTPIDDKRGMEEGVNDNLPTIQHFWLSLETLNGDKLNPKQYTVPSYHVHHLTAILNYPVSIFLIKTNDDLPIYSQLSLLKKPLPCDLNLFNLRTLNDANDQPTRSALLIVHKLNYDCNIGVYNNAFYSELCLNNGDNFDNIDLFVDDIRIESVQRTSLTGIKSHGSISSFKSDPIEAMELKTFNVTFVAV